MTATDTIKYRGKRYDLVIYPTASVRVPEAFYTIAELNDFIEIIEQRRMVSNLALARSMEFVRE